jgi:hypothetical protein
MQANDPAGPVTVLNVNTGTIYHDKGAFNEGDPGYAPDLDDAATVGTIEAQVRAAFPQAVLWPPENPGKSWVINFGIIDHLAEGATRGEAWTNAFLEVAK